MKEKKTPVPKTEEIKKEKDADLPKEVDKDAENEDFDFGGIPKNIPFKRSIGCGG
ncbi:hypothetical protein ACV07N_03820 [Roseivirga echinicomitans]